MLRSTVIYQVSAGSRIQWWPEDKACPGELRAHLPPDYELLGVPGHMPDPWQDHLLEEGPIALSQPLTQRSALQAAGIANLAYRPQTTGPASRPLPAQVKLSDAHESPGDGVDRQIPT